jgi:3-oxoacyl-[acyl-carrier protein] reductase
MNGLPLAGKVAVLIGAGNATDRAVVVALAEAGADVALATTGHTQAEEFAMNSIANEAWVIGREQFVTVMDALDDTAVVAFADQVWDRYGRCDAVVCGHDAPSAIVLDEIAPHEWDATIAANLKGPFLAAQAFGRLMERQGGGTIVLLHHADAGDAAYRAAQAGLAGISEAVAAWQQHGTRASIVDAAADPARTAEDVLGAISGV